MRKIDQLIGYAQDVLQQCEDRRLPTTVVAYISPEAYQGIQQEIADCPSNSFDNYGDAGSAGVILGIIPVFVYPDLPVDRIAFESSVTFAAGSHEEELAAQLIASGQYNFLYDLRYFFTDKRPTTEVYETKGKRER